KPRSSAPVSKPRPDDPRRPDPHQPKADPAAGLSFEDAVAQIESIVQRIEQGEVGLEQSLTEYERGVELIRYCRGVLKNAELKVEQLPERMLAGERSRTSESQNEEP